MTTKKKKLAPEEKSNFAEIFAIVSNDEKMTAHFEQLFQTNGHRCADCPDEWNEKYNTLPLSMLVLRIVNVWKHDDFHGPLYQGDVFKVIEDSCLTEAEKVHAAFKVGGILEKSSNPMAEFLASLR